VLRFIIRNIKTNMPMQNSTQNEFLPSPSTILFLKQYARLCNLTKNMSNGYNGISVVACC
jgi:hypothetical protein